MGSGSRFTSESFNFSEPEFHRLSNEEDINIYPCLYPIHLRECAFNFSEPEFHHLPNAAAAAKSLQLCPTLCDPIDGSPPGSLVPGTLQTRTLEWVAISFSSV